ncbi:MAG: radical SAM protein [Candidatus Binatia bacterium]|jgi:radical SAM protein with 4Fe4S-binding SPASM domain|nr:radical SAM protein [Candidatus Binatia bacterium]MDG2011055.1 radical SAM protein [Candidatus Binatia bacterium]
MTNEENTLADGVKGWLRDRGLTKSNLQSYKYWLPYTVAGGKAWTPQSMTFELTLRCNLSCQMCPLDIPRMMHNKTDADYVKSRQRAEVTTEEVKRTIDDIVEMGVKDMTITGGEVFLRKDAFEIIEYIGKTPIHLCVNTNGWFLRPAEAERLVSLKPHSLSISIDGPDDLHDEIRRGKGSFRRLLEGIRNIQAAKKKLGVRRPKIGITVTVTALNQHRYSEVLDWLKDTGVDTVDFDYMFYTTPEHDKETRELMPLPEHDKEENQDLPMYLRQVNGETLHAESQKAIQKGEEYGIPVGFGPPLKTPEEMERRFLDDEYAFVEKCFYPWKTFRINPYGDVYSCSLDVAFGNIRDKSVKEIWNNDAYTLFRKSLKERGLFPSCAKCCALNNEFWRYLPTFG